jgi:intein/homing endonuclease
MKRKYLIDDKLMDEINTEEKAYWLGFFYADAYNKEKTGQIILELQTQDKNHLQKCAKFFGTPREPFEQKKNKGKYTAYRLELNSRHLSNILQTHGCCGKKSFSIIFPEWLDKSLIRHFIRGYFDGDGCLYINKSTDQLGILFVATKEMIDSISKILKEELQVNSYISHPERYTNNTYRLDSGGSRQVLRFCEWIYCDATIYLERKYNIYRHYKNSHIPRF